MISWGPGRILHGARLCHGVVWVEGKAPNYFSPLHWFGTQRSRMSASLKSRQIQKLFLLSILAQTASKNIRKSMAGLMVAQYQWWFHRYGSQQWSWCFWVFWGDVLAQFISCVYGWSLKWKERCDHWVAFSEQNLDKKVVFLAKACYRILFLFWLALTNAPTLPVLKA